MTPYDDYMSDADRLIERASRRIDPKKAMKSVEIHSLQDIQQIIAAFAPGVDTTDSSTKVSSTLMGEDEGGKMVKYGVSAVTKARSRREMIIDGFDVIKKYKSVVDLAVQGVKPIEINGIEMSPPSLISDDPTSWVDALIMRWMGGKREGLRVKWELGEYDYLYDIYQHKLSRRLREV